MLLFQPQLNITTILTECGFASSASFARKFKQLLGMKPLEYRSRYKLEPRTFPKELIQEMNRLRVVIRQIPPIRVAYVRHMNGFYTDRAHPGILESMRKVSEFMSRRQALHESFHMGLTLDDPYVTPIHKCRFDACVPCDEDVVPEKEVCIQTIPGGMYASISLEGPRHLIWELMHLLHVFWLPNSRYQLEYRPVIEIFGNKNTDDVVKVGSTRAQSGGAYYRVEVLMPVRPKSQCV